MKPNTTRWKTSYVITLVSGLCIIFFLEFLGIFTTTDTYVYDVFFRIRGQEKADPRILIAAIDEKTLSELGPWPLKRTYYAKLLDRLKEARVVGFDLIFTEPSSSDPVLAEAIRRHGRVVLPVYFDDKLHIRRPLPYFSPVETGHIHISLGFDGVAREIFHTISCGTQTVPSLSSRMQKFLQDTLFKVERPCLTLRRIHCITGTK